MASRSPQPGPSTNSDMPPTEFEADDVFVNRHLSKDEVLRNWNLAQLLRELGSKEQCLNFAEEHGMVPTQKLCSKHRIPMKVARSTNKTFGSWFCTKGACRQKTKIIRTKGTFFENIKIDIVHVFYLIYAFSHKWSYNTVINEDPLKHEKQQCLGRTTICDWYKYCREAIVLYQLDRNTFEGKIGGPGKIVQVDKSKFGKRKYSKGCHIEGQWIIGMIEDGSEDLRLEVCPDNINSSEVLIKLIQKHVETGTTIHTDSWGAYECLAEYGYIHKKVNHSGPDGSFIAPDGTHTQHIVSQWRVIRRFFIKDNYNNVENFADSIVEYLWRRHTKKFKKDPFMEVIKAINYIYTNKSKNLSTL